jgi:hypothetical protein
MWASLSVGMVRMCYHYICSQIQSFRFRLAYRYALALVTKPHFLAVDWDSFVQEPSFWQEAHELSNQDRKTQRESTHGPVFGMSAGTPQINIFERCAVMNSHSSCNRYNRE